MGDIEIVYTDDPTHAICGECGNGMWPDVSPCKHKIARMSPEQRKAVKKAKRKARKERKRQAALARAADPRYQARNTYEALASGAIRGITYEEHGYARELADAERRKFPEAP